MLEVLGGLVESVLSILLERRLAAKEKEYAAYFYRVYLALADVIDASNEVLVRLKKFFDGDRRSFDYACFALERLADYVEELNGRFAQVQDFIAIYDKKAYDELVSVLGEKTERLASLAVLMSKNTVGMTRRVYPVVEDMAQLYPFVEYMTRNDRDEELTKKGLPVEPKILTQSDTVELSKEYKRGIAMVSRLEKGLDSYCRFLKNNFTLAELFTRPPKLPK